MLRVPGTTRRRFFNALAGSIAAPMIISARALGQDAESSIGARAEAIADERFELSASRDRASIWGRGVDIPRVYFDEFLRLFSPAPWRSTANSPPASRSIGF